MRDILIVFIVSAVTVAATFAAMWHARRRPFTLGRAS